MTRGRLLVFVLVALLANVACFVSVAADRADVRTIAHGIIKPGGDPRAAIEACLAFIHSQLQDNSNESVAEMPYWTRQNYLWNPRRVGPQTVLRHGTHQIAPCQSHARAMIALLEAHNITARAVALHDANLRGSHGIVEVDLGERGTEVIDPQHGIIYRHSDGRPASLEDLRADPALAVGNQLGALNLHIVPGKDTVRAPYPAGVDGYRLDFPAYCNYRDFGPLRWRVRDLLNSWYGDTGYLAIKWPHWYVMWPAYNLAFGLDLLFAACIISVLVFERLRRRRMPKTA